MILNIRKIYIKYFDQFNKVENQCDSIRMCALELEQDFQIINKKKTVILF